MRERVEREERESAIVLYIIFINSLWGEREREFFWNEKWKMMGLDGLGWFLKKEEEDKLVTNLKDKIL